jgi:hypothetical protein
MPAIEERNNSVDETSTGDGMAQKPNPIGVHGQQHAVLLGLECFDLYPASPRSAQGAGTGGKAEMAGKVTVA